ncbi:hypothetical protein [Tautonia plasticadhaerens]|uniref:Uncharacterized protein n=1 Tax=Tautonia plasticadhaerens TaxID=2527974 RepID=A0A518H673_9BACT|nr:hypothetical protein [Tautonia plasticadhaerens]QDV36336.1 hypothetical protein ElP_42560 [Tautonia plasticadhaerens]
MGLDAVVHCSCFAMGMTSPPPFPVARDRDGLPDFEPADDSGGMAMSRYFDWLQSCCPHPLLMYALERIGSWDQVDAFREAIDRAGPSRFPVLARELPGENSGRTTAKAAKVALRELDRFRRLPEVGRDTFLIDTRTGGEVARRTEAGDGVVLSGPTYRVSLADDELIIEDADFAIEVFRARRFRQILLQPDPGDGRLRREQAEFTDLDTGATHVAACPIPKPMAPAGQTEEEALPAFPDWEYPELLHVERRPIRPAGFAETVDALERIFRAAVETSSPVHWC